MTEPSFFHYFWLAAIAVTVLNALFLKFRSTPYIRQRPELASGYRTLFFGLLFWGSLPWLVMGLGIESGHVPGILSFFHPRDGNPFVLAFLATVILLWILGFYWLFARRGAEFLVEHPGLLRSNPQNPTLIKISYCLLVLVGIVALVVISTTNLAPFPR